MPRIDYLERELKPHGLTSAEVDDPCIVLDDLFSYAHLPEWRQLLWEWHKATVCGSIKSMSRQERDSVCTSYEYMSKLIEAAYLIHCGNGSK